MDLLRHALATVAYRGAKTLRGAPEGFPDFSAGAGTRTPVQILAHLGDLFDWALLLAQGNPAWKSSNPLPWPQEVQRFFASIQALDNRLLAPLACPPERLLQGPIADALTHVGQLALLRRMAASPVRGENYFVAEIVAGKFEIEHPPKNPCAP
ncbi:MAG TPA: hypothetical protein VGK29_08075 [Paludibaculum sp.]|jgi:hypothetical protein